MSHGPVSLDTTRRALTHIPAHERDLWVRMALAVKSEHGEDGFHVWDSWSQTADNYEARAAKTVWKSAKLGELSIGTLFYEAKQRGFSLNGEGARINPAEIDQHRKERAEALARDEAKRKEDQARAAQWTADIWKAAKPASPDHPYLQRKAVTPTATMRELDAARVREMIGYTPKQSEESLEGRLLVLPVKIGASLSTLELIDEKGRKTALYGGARSGGYWSPESLPEADYTGTLVAGEGAATMLSIRAATGLPVVAVLSAGNLAPVSKAMREKYPNARLVIAGDLNAKHSDKSKSEERAAKAAAESRGLLALPDFGADRGEEQTDFNDLANAKGQEAVKAAIGGARAVEDQKPAEEAGSRWPVPEPLPELPPVPAFNFDALPGPLRRFVQDVSERKQCPPEFAAVGVMVMAGAAIGRRVGIKPKQYDPWTVVPNVWGMIVGKSGLMKSPALADAISPLKRMQAKAFEEYETAKADYEVSERAAKIRATEAEKKAREAYSKDRSTNLAAMLQPDVELEQPKPRRYIVNDSTPEALCETLRHNPNGVLCERDELIGLLRSMDKEDRQEARALYLTAADGDKAFNVDRMTREGGHIAGVCVSIVGGIQPGVLAGYVRETQRGGSGDDGLLQRFGLMVYPDVSKAWRNVDRLEDRDARLCVHALIEKLCTLTPEQVGAEIDPDGGIPSLRFEAAAQSLFVEWLTDLEGRIRNDDEHPAFVSHLSKYRKNVPALALINHLAEGGTGPVTEAALARALMLMDVLEKHARRVYSYAARPDLDSAKTILAKLRAGKLPVEFTARHVYRQGWSGLTTPEETGAALRVLTDHGYLHERTSQAEAGGRSSTIYRTHPSVRQS